MSAATVLEHLNAARAALDAAEEARCAAVSHGGFAVLAASLPAGTLPMAGGAR